MPHGTRGVSMSARTDLDQSNLSRQPAQSAGFLLEKSRMEDEGPEYNIDGAALKKFRFRARKGLATVSKTERREYGAAVEAAVLAAQRAALRRAGVSLPTPRCASGTTHNTGAAIDKAIRDQQRAALLAFPSQVRRARSPHEWRSKYDEAIAAKRKRESEPPPPPRSRRERAEAHVRAARARLEMA